MLIIGLTGRAQSGKDEFVKILQRHHNNVKRIGFADKLKQSIANLFNISLEDLESYKTDPQIKVELVMYYPPHSPEYKHSTTNIERSFTIREILQRFGTEAGRAVFGDSFWVDNAFVNIGNPETLCISDVRFSNEAEKIKSLGGIVIRIRRNEAEKIPVTHASEEDISRYAEYEIDNNGTLEEYETKILNLMKELKIAIR